ncbi:hypothetical protein FA15DRAFT_686798 [Coprinopsis marcescibilis]|uniref:EGF-like domain-containing protein n=1 Tax=Coprinopsis marcescibilis TaxID=230819 RepID=A0A5C3LBT4_COPMA|nr:hypothetical protein FA15DRAFT_686798 [Coprinopsis marcescibilis]
MSMKLAALFFSLVTTVVAQSTPVVICVPGQCLQGFSNTTIGAELSAPGAPAPLRLLPGEYSANTDPALLHDLLVNPSASLKPSSGFDGGLSTLPLNLKLSPGVAIYSDVLYSGRGGFLGLPTEAINSTVPFNAQSLAVSENTWVALARGSNLDERVVLWDSAPDLTQLSLPSTLTLLDIQSTNCNPTCAGAGVCSALGQCTCPPNFSGASCESCAAGFFGPTCQACPADCEECDEGVAGTGRCLTREVGERDPRRCGCTNGACNPDGSCECAEGWQDGGNGENNKCAVCAPGFFLSSTGDCTACGVGCERCSAPNGQCEACRSGFSLDSNERTKCDPVRALNGGGIQCPPGAFSSGGDCQPCSNSCGSCSGPGIDQCLSCPIGQFNVGGRCVAPDGNGVCPGTDGMVADNVRLVCDACPSRCSSCLIPSYNGASTLAQLQCSGCLPGSFLSNGRCVETCPAGTFVNPQDNLTCIPCSSTCATCSGSADFCLACPNGGFALNGQCVPSCPSGTFTSNQESRTCASCHADCSTCSGPSFTQCITCPSSRPVLSTVTGATSGRCLATCNKNQFFDAQSGRCGSCTGSGPQGCLSCQSPGQVVRGGRCVDAGCANNAAVIPGLGVCLSELVLVPSSTEGEAPLPTITGIADPAPTPGRRPLEWWQILLMALGCAFIFLVVLWCFRRRNRKRREQKTKMFAEGKGIGSKKWGWKWGSIPWKFWKFGNLGKSGGGKSKKAKESMELPVYNHHEMERIERERAREVAFSGNDEVIESGSKKSGYLKPLSARRDPPLSTKQSSRVNSNRRSDDLESYIDAYDYSRQSMSIRSHTPSTLPDLDGYYPTRRGGRNQDRDGLRRQVTGVGSRHREMDVEKESIYSQVTGLARQTPEPRIPVKRDLVTIGGGSERSVSPPMNKLRKPVPAMARQGSDDSLESVVIAPSPYANQFQQQQRQREGVLVDLDGESSRGMPLQYTGFVNSNNTGGNGEQGFGGQQPTMQFETLSEAQTYAMSYKPQLASSLAGSGSGAGLNGLVPNITGGPMGYTLAWVPTHLTGSSATVSTAANGNVNYWVQPNGGSSGLSSATLNNSMSNLGGLKPNFTGSSSVSGGSKNPFRQQQQYL